MDNEGASQKPTLPLLSEFRFFPSWGPPNHANDTSNFRRSRSDQDPETNFRNIIFTDLHRSILELVLCEYTGENLHKLILSMFDCDRFFFLAIWIQIRRHKLQITIAQNVGMHFLCCQAHQSHVLGYNMAIWTIQHCQSAWHFKESFCFYPQELNHNVLIIIFRIFMVLCSFVVGTLYYKQYTLTELNFVKVPLFSYSTTLWRSGHNSMDSKVFYFISVFLFLSCWGPHSFFFSAQSTNWWRTIWLQGQRETNLRAK